LLPQTLLADVRDVADRVENAPIDNKQRREPFPYFVERPVADPADKPFRLTCRAIEEFSEMFVDDSTLALSVGMTYGARTTHAYVHGPRDS
jgi:hypothetical protein